MHNVANSLTIIIADGTWAGLLLTFHVMFNFDLLSYKRLTESAAS